MINITTLLRPFNISIINLKEGIAIYTFKANTIQLKRAINIRCTQHFIYFESRIKSLVQLRVIFFFFNVLYITSAFTISTYFINLGYLDLTRMKFQ